MVDNRNTETERRAQGSSPLPASARRWIAWRPETRTRKDGSTKRVKTPVSPTSGKRIDTYAKRDYWRRDKLPANAKPGFVLGLDGDSAIIGIDLDTCRAAETGRLTPWAREVLDTWDSYAEISPSGTGVKAYARVSAETYRKLRKMLDGGLRRTWATAAGEHPPGVMLCLGGYFAVTGEAWGKAGLSEIDAATVRKGIEIGERIERKAKREAGVNESSGWNDDTGSGDSWRLAVETRRDGGTYEDFAHAIEDHPEALRSCEESNRGFDGQLERDWRRACAKVDKEESSVIDKFGEDEESDRADESKNRASLEWFWGDEDDGSGDLEPLIDGVLNKKTLAAIYGPYGQGKSFVALDIALHVATGRKWFGFDVDAGAVMYLAAEGYHGMKRRRAAWCKQRKLEETPKNFALVRGTLDLQKPGAAVAKLAKEAKERKVALIVLDTLNAVFGGADENDSAAMSKARHALERLRDLSGATVLVIHHAGKDLSKGLRGSSVLGGALDTILLVNRWRIVSAPPHGKQKDMETADDIGFALHAVDLGKDAKEHAVKSAVIVSEAVEKFEEEEEDEMLTTRERDALSVLVRLNLLDGPATRDDWREALRSRPWVEELESAAFRMAFKAAVDGLTQKGMIEKNASGKYERKA